MSTAHAHPDHDDHAQSYYVPAQSHWPIVAASGLFLLMFGMGNMMNNPDGAAKWLTLAGLLVIIWMFFGWFSAVARESMEGLYDEQMDRSFRWGMGWFIFSEVMFFAAFFGTLFYVRQFAVPWLAGEGSNAMTNELLWPGFMAEWPLMTTPDTDKFPGPEQIINPWHLPLINTVLLVASSVTLTWAHHALQKDKRAAVKGWLALTLVLGVCFLIIQAEEYIEAYTELGLTLASGIYGGTFFILTGFHGLHVTMGSIILLVMLIRIMKGHFDAKHHFGFEAAAWYWHFVDVVWLGLFLFVYVF
ncbi:cytochrome c oxidase subunit 3 [Oceanospirillum sediminis]|uniref:cytochrome-c oxidase n=1 Tax=Oceanospirillum sediminis TaxID=2760088 RepID=A0A839INQ6_9GAMM|nr:cytochrome c oxidase subunit 3 [Oceanospirillum sediminis]MBB1486875.1 cytochrome c oxidase subunit 3 [Oceanospirillum sediminis]